MVELIKHNYWIFCIWLYYVCTYWLILYIAHLTYNNTYFGFTCRGLRFLPVLLRNRRIVPTQLRVYISIFIQKQNIYYNHISYYQPYSNSLLDFFFTMSYSCWAFYLFCYFLSFSLLSRISFFFSSWFLVSELPSCYVMLCYVCLFVLVYVFLL